MNQTGQNAKIFQNRVFANRNFHQARKYNVTRLASTYRLLTPFFLLARALEWYIVWERTPGVPGHMGPQLLQLLNAWLTVDTRNAAQVTAFVNQVIAVIPDICRTPN